MCDITDCNAIRISALVTADGKSGLENNITASCKLMKSHLTKHVQDLYNLSIQYNDLKSVLYSNSEIWVLLWVFPFWIVVFFFDIQEIINSSLN